METGIRVADVMSRSLVTIQENASIFDAAKVMKRRGVGSLLVKDPKGKIYGILTERDLSWKALALGRTRSKVRELASKPLLTIPEGADLSEAARLMGKRGKKRLVVTRDSKIVGVISDKDIVRLSPSLYDLIAEEQRTGFKPEYRRSVEEARKAALLPE